MKTNQEIAEAGEFMRATVGSKLYGLDLPGQSDTDEMGLCIEAPEYVIGLNKFEHWKPTPSEGRDLTIYSLRKWCRLALKGDLTALLMLFVEEEQCSIWRWPAPAIDCLRVALFAKSVANPILGHLKHHRQRIHLDHGDYDTKHAMHMLRIGFMGRELLRDGKITLPMPEEERALCLATRRGEVPMGQVISVVAELERDIFYERECGLLPDRPDKDYVNSWLVGAYLAAWKSHYGWDVAEAAEDYPPAPDHYGPDWEWPEDSEGEDSNECV